MENKYQQGKIYKIVSANSSKCYVGSTYQTLDKRFQHHRCCYNTNGNNCFADKIFECGDVSIELIKEFPCNSKRELEREEGKYQLELDCVNKYIAGRTRQEYYQSEQYKQNQKRCYLKHRDKRLKHFAEYREKNREHINSYRRQRVICEFCKKDFSYSSIKKHIKRKHSSLGKVGKTAF